MGTRPEPSSALARVDADPAVLALNRALEPLELDVVTAAPSVHPPAVFLVGPPRSGTTLLSQVLVASLPVDYVSNFVARFWLAPAVAMRLEDDLQLREHAAISFRSEGGVTPSPVDPHEFGYFWRRWFPFGTTHQLSSEGRSLSTPDLLAGEVAAMTKVRNRSMLFKNLTCGLQARELAEALDGPVFIRIHRSEVDVAASILRERRQRDPQAWWSLRPPGYTELLRLPIQEQAAGQVVLTERSLDDALSGIPHAARIDVQYEELRASPAGAVRDIAQRLRMCGVEVEPDVHRLPSSFAERRWRAVDPDDSPSRIEEAFSRVREETGG